MPEPLSEWSPARRVKYRVRTRLPGGARARRKLATAAAMDAFDRALAGAAGKVCVDLGANVGAVTRRMAASAGHVFAFEPDPWAVERLRANAAGLDNVTVVPAAAGVREGTANLYRHPRYSADPALYSESSSLIAEKENVDGTRGRPVPQVDFPRWLERLPDDVWLLKMDIEGAEVALLEVLFARPDLLSRIRHIFAETHERMIPGHAQRVGALRAHARRTHQPVVSLDWH